MRMLVCAIVGALLLLAGSVRAEVVMVQQGWEIRSAGAGTVTVKYPRIGASGELSGPTDVKVNGTEGAEAKYANGTTLWVVPQPDGRYMLHFRSVPAEVQNFRIDAQLPISLAGKGTWSIDDKKNQPLPAAHTAGKPMLFQGDAKRFSVDAGDGSGFAIVMDYGYQQLQDNREWKTSNFTWFTQSGMPAASDAGTFITIGLYDTPEGKPTAAGGAAPQPPPPAPEPAPAPAAKSGKPTFGLSDKGVTIDAAVAGQFALTVPKLSEVQGGEAVDLKRSTDGKTLAFRYPAGGEGTITRGNDGTVKAAFRGLPAGADKLKFEMHIPITFASGGKWSVAGGQIQDFPREKPASPFLYQGHAASLAVIHPTGAGFEIGGLAEGSFQQLQDNREWNWPVFAWILYVPLPAGNEAPAFTFTLASPAGAAAQIKPLIDRFGQHMNVDFPEKVRSEQELKDDLQRDAEYYASLTPPQLDRYGGLPGSRETYNLKQTGFFHIDRIGDKQVLVDPEGNLFFQLGLCTFASPVDDYTLVKGREQIYEWLPSTTDPLMKTAWRPNHPGVVSFYLANWVRKHGEPFDRAKFIETWIGRARKWGYNSAGAFAGFTEAGMPVIRKHDFPHVNFLPVDGAADPIPGANKVWDPFTEGIEAKLDAAFARSVAPRANDPLIIGWFITNEPLIQDVPKVVPGLKGSKHAAKRRLVQLLQEKYGTIEKFATAWDLKAGSFEELLDTPLLVGTKTASEDMQAYMQLFLDRRYSLVNTCFRKHAPNHLLIGDRWMPSTASSEMLVRTAGKYLDVVSVNYYTIAMETNFLKRLHDWSGGKPLLLSEFYYSCRDQGLTGGGTRVANQTERGLAYRNYVEQAMITGFVVGIQWFSFIDQAATGRFFEGFNGEATNIGIVNVADRPYKAFLEEAMKTNYRVYDVLLGNTPAFIFDDPRFTQKVGERKKVAGIYRMTGPVALDGRSNEWPAVPPLRIDASGMVMGTRPEDFEGAFRLAWDENKLYFFCEVIDTTPMQNDNKDDAIWGDDSAELFIGFEDLDRGGSLQFGDRQVLLRAHAADPALAPARFVNAPRDHSAEVMVIPGIDGRSYTIEAAIPFEALGFVPAPGQEILFDLCLNDGEGGRRQLAWNGTAKNSSDRGGWGRAEFMP